MMIAFNASRISGWSSTHHDADNARASGLTVLKSFI